MTSTLKGEENGLLLEEIAESNLATHEVVAKLYLMMVNAFGNPAEYKADPNVAQQIDFDFAFEQLQALDDLSRSLYLRDAELSQAAAEVQRFDEQEPDKRSNELSKGARGSNDSGLVFQSLGHSEQLIGASLV